MQLVEPSEKYYASYLEAIEEYQQNHVDTFAFIGMTRDNVFEYMKDSKDGSKLPEGYVREGFMVAAGLMKEEFIPTSEQSDIVPPSMDANIIDDSIEK